MSMKRQLIFSTGLTARERTRSFDVDHRALAALLCISAAISPTIVISDSVSSRSKKVISFGSVTPGKEKLCAMRRPSQLVRCSAFASVTVGVAHSADDEHAEEQRLDADLVIGDVQTAAAAESRRTRGIGEHDVADEALDEAVVEVLDRPWPDAECACASNFTIGEVLHRRSGVGDERRRHSRAARAAGGGAAGASQRARRGTLLHA